MPQEAAGPSWGSRALALAIGLVLALGLAEVALRVVRPAQVSVIRYPCIYRPDAVTGFRYEPGARGVVAGHFEIENEVAINSLGFYDVEPERDASPRILAVGDSFTAAMNVPIRDVWTSVLERALRDAGQEEADVVNLGLDGTGTDVHVALLEAHRLRFAPELMLIAFYANDLADVTGPRLERECHRGYVLSYPSAAHRDELRAVVDAHLTKRIRRALFEHLYVVRLAAAAALPRMNPYRIEFLQPRLAAIRQDAAQRRAGRARWQAAMASLRTLPERCACRVVVVPVPPRSNPSGSLDMWRQYGARELEVMDVLPTLDRFRSEAGLAREDLYFRRDLHFNATGNALFGRAVAALLTEDSRESIPRAHSFLGKMVR